LLVLARDSGPARAEEFPLPPELAPAVRFWIDVFTRYTLSDVVIHDGLEPGVVYQVVQGGEQPDEIARRVRATADRLVLGRLLDSPASVAPLLPDATAWPADREQVRVRVQRGLREAFADALVAKGLYRAVVEDALASEGLPPALAALPLIESSYHPGAVSPAGAAGLWQLTRDTGRRYLTIRGEVDERHDPVRASRAAARHLRALREALPSWPLALTAYNRGPAGVERARRAVGSNDLGVLVTRYRGPGFGFMARNFYAQFLAALHVARHRTTYFPEIAPARVLEYRVKRGDTLSGVARRHGVSLGVLRAKNGLRSAAIQPGQRILIRL
jgi:membrane-bound lytic murein transglycosylase D